MKRTDAKWRDLTSKQKMVFGNGCGSQSLEKWNIKEKLDKYMFGWFFEASCRHHDFGYTKGGGFRDKLRCDRKFYDAMVRDCRKLGREHKTKQRYASRAMSEVYYIAVLFMGWFSFKWGDQKTTIQIIAYDEALKYKEKYSM